MKQKIDVRTTYEAAKEILALMRDDSGATEINEPLDLIINALADGRYTLENIQEMAQSFMDHEYGN